MTTVDAMLRRFERIDVVNEAKQSLYDVRYSYVDQQKRQLLHGRDKNDKLIGKYKSAQYAAKKFALNGLAGLGNVDLRVTGRFYAGIFVDVRDMYLYIDSEDSKTAVLTEKYGNDIFGLSKTYRVPFVQKAGRVLLLRLRAALHLNEARAIA